MLSLIRSDRTLYNVIQTQAVCIGMHRSGPGPVFGPVFGLVRSRSSLRSQYFEDWTDGLVFSPWSRGPPRPVQDRSGPVFDHVTELT
jgi:hypothetical protein